MGRRKSNPAHSLSRFIVGIYDYYHDKGMPQKTAKARMVDHTLEECVKLMRQEEEIPDEMVVLMAQWMSRALNNRGAQMTNVIKEMEKKTTTDLQLLESPSLLQPLRDIKAVKDAVDQFIETYKGWSETDGKSNK